MSLYSEPPELRTLPQDKPTLLVCWWITIFCTTIILLRVCGRYIRTERLFIEDKTAALAIVPLFLRMGCVHVILIYGTNNAQFEGVNLTDDDIRRRQIGSGLVLASRIFYAATLWVLKATILEFFKRLTGVSWAKSSRLALLFIRLTLAATFVAIIISDLAECRPFANYWQVLPDPGGQCRQGYAQLLTMAVCNVVTDLLLVFFPIPIILGSHMSVKRKIQLILLFSLSLGVVGVTLYRVPHIIYNDGRQQTRSLLASVELLFATTAANALVLGSFVRDRGIKKRKFKYGSTVDSFDRSSGSRGSRRPTMNRHWGSDEDLVRDIGLGVNPELRQMPDSPGQDGIFHPAPMAKMTDGMNLWQFPNRRKSAAAHSDDSSVLTPGELTASRSNSTVTPRKVSFFDVGGLLGDDARSSTLRDSYLSNVDPLSPHSAPSPTVPAAATGQRRGSTALLQDLGGLLGPFSAKPRSKSVARGGTELTALAPEPSKETPQNQSQPDKAGTEPEPLDAGGLLSSEKK